MKFFAFSLIVNGICASDLLHQETQSTYNDDGSRVFTMPQDEIGNGSENSILHDETYTQQNGGGNRQFTQQQTELGSLQEDEYCSAHNMCQSQCCQEPYGNRRLLNDLLYQDTSSTSNGNSEPVKSQTEEVVYNQDAGNILYDETTQDTNQDGQRVFTQMQDELGSSQGARVCVPRDNCEAIEAMKLDSSIVYTKKHRSPGRGGKKKNGAIVIAWLFFLISVGLAIGLCVMRYVYRKQLAEAGLNPIPPEPVMQLDVSPNRQGQYYNNVSNSAHSSATDLENVVNSNS